MVHEITLSYFLHPIISHSFAML